MAIEEISYNVRGPKLLHEMSTAEVTRALEETDLALISFGAIEQHGAHLPLGTDAFITEETIRRVLRKLGDRGRRAIGCVIRIGISHNFLSFPGSITLSTETFIQAHIEICQCLLQQGFHRFAIVSGNGGNVNACKIAMEKIAREPNVSVIFIDPLPYQYLNRDKIVKAPKLDHHAGEAETSKILAVHPELVDIALAEPIPMAEALVARTKFGAGVTSPIGDWKKIAPRGYVGDPTLAEASTGDRLYELNAEWITDVLMQEFFTQ